MPYERLSASISDSRRCNSTRFATSSASVRVSSRAAPCSCRPFEVALDFGQFAVHPQLLERPDAVRCGCRGAGLTADFLDHARPPLYLDARRASEVRSQPATPAGIAPVRRIPSVASPSRSPSSRFRQRRRPGLRIPQNRPDQAALGRFDLSQRGQFPLLHRHLPVDGRLADLRPHNLFRNPRFVRQPVGKLVTRRSIRNTGRNRQHRVQKLPPAVVLREIVPGRRAIEEVVEVRPRIPQLFLVRRPGRPS